MTQRPWHSELVCPTCRGGLTVGPRALACAQCVCTFPMLDDGLAFVVPRGGDSKLALTRFTIEQQVLASKREQKALDGDTWSPLPRDELRVRISAAIAHNAELLLRLKAYLPPVTSESVVRALDESSTPKGVYEELADVLNYVERDWSTDERNEEQVRITEEHLVSALAATRLAGAERGRAIVLGAAAGRFARDLTCAFDDVLAFELSGVMALAHRAVRECGFDFYVERLSNKACAADQLRHVVASTSAPSHVAGVMRPERLHYAVADATALPIASGSVSAVFSIFFTDVMPLSAWLPEIRRVLAPGGAFVHFGPLHYHFSDRKSMLCAEDVRNTFERSGFSTQEERWVSMAHGPASASRRGLPYDNWCFGARREVDQPFSEDAVLVLGAGVRVESSAIAGEAGERKRTLTLTLPGGDAFGATLSTAGLVDGIDGRRTVREVVAHARAVSVARFSEAAAFEFLRGLVDAGVARVAP